MDDLISRQSAIKAIEESKLEVWLNHYEHDDGYNEGLETALEEIKDLPSAQPEQRWIPCSERLPEDTAIVTVETKTFKHKYVCEAVWIPRWSKKAEDDNWEDCSEYNEDEDEYYVLEGWYERVYNWDEYSYVGIEDNVIAWMPRPEPYDAERRTDETD